ncbi:hypothetical protein COOONC_06560 [Cooperia oncophora]
MSACTQAAAWIIVICILLASFYFYNNHQIFSYVFTSDELYITPAAITPMMENECKWPVLQPMDEISSVSAVPPRNIECGSAMKPFVTLDAFGFLELSPPTVGGNPFVETDISYVPYALISR